MNKHALLLAMLTATLGLTACGGGGSSSGGDTPETPNTGTGGDSNGGTDSGTDSDDNNDGTPPANSALTMTFELGDSHYLAVLDSNGEWQQKTGESEVVVDVASSSEPVTYLYLCTDGEGANYSYMRTLYLNAPSRARLCQNDSSAPDGALIPIASADSTQVIDILVTETTNKSWDDVVEDIELIGGRDVPRTYLAVGQNGDDYFIQRRDNVQLQEGDTLTIDFTSDDTVKVSPVTATADVMEYGLVYRTLNSVSRLTLTLDNNRYIPIPAVLMRDGDWFDEYYRFSDETRFSRATQAPESEGFIQASLPPITLSNVGYSQDKLTASAPLLGDAPESLPHGVVSLDYRFETDDFEYFSFSQYIMLPVGHSGTASIPTVDLTALPGFPQWGMFDYNGDQLEGWQYGYSAALSGSFERDTASLYRDSQPE